MRAQISLLDEIIVDNFAGGGGASTGIELATGRPVAIAINHDPAAILMHRKNHPHTEHLQASVWDVDPEQVCAGRPVGLAWFSPDCKHFSKAKGSALVDRNIRGLAWIVLRWAGTVRPRVIILENVEEFTTWGPVRKGKPVKRKQGQTFQKWLSQLEALGYKVEHRELVAADYGAPTTRKRFVLVARCDGQPIVWPARTHAPKDSEEVRSGKLLPWRAAAEIIDFSLPMYSIFATKEEIKETYGVNVVRPLAENTLRRAIRGVDKYTIRSGDPFLIPVGYGERAGQAPRVHDLGAPLPTVVSTVKQHLVEPLVAPFVAQAKFQNAAQDIQKPLSTITSVGAHELLTPVMAPYTFSNTGGSVGAPADQPIGTVRTAGGQVLAAANLMQYHTEKDPSASLRSAQDDRAARVNDLDDPLPTVDASNRYGLAAAHLTEYYGNGNPLDPRDPMHTVTGHDREALTAVHLDKYFAGGYKCAGNGADEPLSTITVEPRHSLVATHIQKYFGGVVGAKASDPLPTVTAVDHNALTAAHMMEFKGQDVGQRADRPLRTITASAGKDRQCGGGTFGLAAVRIEKYEPDAPFCDRWLGHWPEIRALLNKHCGYKLADDEILLLRIGEAWYFLSDITMRMLTPKELYAAMGFPPDYIIERDYTGKPYPKSAQVARCGNAVCPQMASAVVRANLPEWAVELHTMAELERMVAV